MTDEIKQGDKVRVSKDAPRMYISGHCRFFYGVESVVEEIEDGNAIIRRDDGSVNKALAIPCKYLVKVDAEAKEAKFKIGDRVRKKKWDKDTTISYVEWHGTWQTYVYRFAEQEYGFNCHKEEDITLVSRRAKEPKFKAGDCVKISFEWNDLPIGEKLVIKRLETIDCRKAYMYSIEGYRGTVIESMLHPYTEPTAPTIKVGDRVRSKGYGLEAVVLGIDSDYIAVRRDDGIKQEWKISMTGLVEPTEQTEEEKPNHTIKIPLEVDLTDSYWDAYTADLAKEVALKVSYKYNDPKEAAEYAVSVAKAVVEGLKRK